MTDKEMHKLSRRELLQLLLAQVSETEELKRSLAERDDQLTELHENYERLRKRLDQKDAKIHDLRNTLHEERTTRRIELQEAGSIAEAALRLNGIFDIAQKAADQYLENIKMLNDRLASGEGFPDLDDLDDIDDLEEEMDTADADAPDKAWYMTQAEDVYGDSSTEQIEKSATEVPEHPIEQTKDTEAGASEGEILEEKPSEQKDLEQEESEPKGSALEESGTEQTEQEQEEDADLEWIDGFDIDSTEGFDIEEAADQEPDQEKESHPEQKS